jgi:hypothetical protein
MANPAMAHQSAWLASAGGAAVFDTVSSAGRVVVVTPVPEEPADPLDEPEAPVPVPVAVDDPEAVPDDEVVPDDVPDVAPAPLVTFPDELTVVCPLPLLPLIPPPFATTTGAGPPTPQEAAGGAPGEASMAATERAVT